jgi:hypothetical protein
LGEKKDFLIFWLEKKMGFNLEMEFFNSNGGFWCGRFLVRTAGQAERENMVEAHSQSRALISLSR